MQTYRYTVHYIRGIENVVAGYLSRAREWQLNVFSESDVHLGSSWTSADVSDICRRRREVRSSPKGSLLVDYQSVSAERIACLLSRLQSRYKAFKLLNS